jgi:hypothetical protein
VKLGSIRAGAALAVALSLAGAARAQTAEDKATARSLADEGQRAFDARDYPRALDLFRRARALVPAPTLTLAVARTEAAVGQLVEAQEAYRRVVVDGPGEHPPPAFKRAVDDAVTELAALEPRVPYVVIEVHGPPGARVTLDGVDLPRASLGVRRAVNPGSHVARAMADGFSTSVRPFEVAEGAADRIALTMLASEVVEARRPSRGPFVRALGYAAVGGAVRATLTAGLAGAFALEARGVLSARCPSGTCGAAEQAGVHGYQDLGGLAWGAAGAAGGLGLFGAIALTTTSGKPYGRDENALVPTMVGAGMTGVALGAVAGAMTLSLGRELDAACPSGACPASQYDGVTSYRSLATTSVISLAAGGTFVVAGAIVAVVGRRAPAPTTTGALEPYVGLGAVGLRGAFE